MRRSIMATALAGALLTGWATPSAAQTQGIVIQNNGVDSADSATGADNVNISHDAGSGQSLSGGGVNNETARAPKERDRKDRGARNSAAAAPAEEYAAPVEEYAAPAEGDYQAYADAAAPQETAAAVDASTQQVLKLPSTGSGSSSTMPLAAIAAGIAAFVFGATSLRRPQTS